MRWFWLSVLLVLVAWGCAEVRDTPQTTQFTAVTAPQGVSVFYDRDIQALFNRSCTGGCHEPGGSGVVDTDLDLTSSVSYAELLDVTASKNGPQVVSGEPESSLLVWKIEGLDASGRAVFGDPMPLGRPLLTAGEVAQVRTWIEEGALWSIAPPSPPRVLSAAALGETTVEVIFDKAVETNSAQVATNYNLQEFDGQPVAIVSVQVEGSDRVVLILGAPLSAGNRFEILVSGVTDDSGLASNGASAEFRFTPVVSLAAQIQPVFNAGCAFVGCHAASDQFAPGADLVLDAQIASAQLVGQSSAQAAGQILVVPGDPGASYLLAKLDGSATIGDRMPVGGPFLTPGETQAFRLWIEQGAEDN